MARFLPRVGRARFVLPALIVGGALIGATAAMGGAGTSTTIPVSFAGTNACVVPAESFVGSGHMHFLLSDNVSNSGNVQSHLEVNISGLQAVTTTGKKYVVIDQEEKTLTFDSTDGAPAHETVEYMLQFVRSGEDGTPVMSGDDFYEHYLAHITANANGIVTVEDVETDTRCK
jgi:hypothetical protein